MTRGRGGPALTIRPVPARLPGVRLDTHVCTGYKIPPNYDSMIAKLLVYQPTRELAFAVMRRALAEFRVGELLRGLDHGFLGLPTGTS